MKTVVFRTDFHWNFYSSSILFPWTKNMSNVNESVWSCSDRWTLPRLMSIENLFSFNVKYVKVNVCASVKVMSWWINFTLLMLFVCHSFPSSGCELALLKCWFDSVKLQDFEMRGWWPRELFYLMKFYLGTIPIFFSDFVSTTALTISCIKLPSKIYVSEVLSWMNWLRKKPI